MVNGNKPSIEKNTDLMKSIRDSLKHEALYAENEDSIRPYKTSILKPVPIQDKADQITKELRNLALKQDIELKKETLNKLFKFLVWETTAIFVFSFLQATDFIKFQLDDWSFRLLVAATIAQITFMLQVAVKHLFPSKEVKDESRYA